MADKKISDFTAATSIASADLIEIETAGGNSRKVEWANARPVFSGALAHKASTQTGANYSSGVVVTWDSETSGFDTDNYHDNSTNPSRITISANGKYVFKFGLEISAVSASDFVRALLIKNGSVAAFVGSGRDIREVSAVVAVYLNGVSAEIDCVATDYFEVWLDTEADTSVDVNPSSWFSVYRVA